ncbi:hypothetical protein N7493_005211 [Penicillium malachiteum]|uniref:RING-type domain-containing protein n=1 Tax=Penicillium malachiteum TaxID=1324776 RepID=A0AAD6MWD9_9EURO|nr:hypothetical protein N7493_005211 [Penicillium malachiteum]
MSSRQQIDSVIDDDDEFCPLCIEEFDLSDKNFKPCPCGYQICQFCYNNIKTHSEEGRCPNCRRPYDDSTIQYKIPDAEEFKADLALKHRKAAAAKKKEAEKREIEASSRKNLAGVRVVQKNLVYVIGLNPTIRDENQLLQTLRGREYFGQYGDIEKIVVSKAKPGGNPHQGIGVYVTFSRKLDAATCIGAVDGSSNGDRVLRAQYGTTKYCSSFLRNEQCNNRNCTFLHETGEDSESYSRSDLSSMNTISSQRQHLPTIPHPRPAQPISHAMRRQPSKDDSISGRSAVPDGPALPSSASWANKDAAIRTRRASLTGSQASQSPRPASVTVATPITTIEEPKRVEKPSPITQVVQEAPSPVETRSPTSPTPPRRSNPAPELPSPFDTLVKDLMSPEFRFIFSPADLPPEEIKHIQNYPSFIDPYGGVKRRAMREKAEQERLKRDQELLQTVAAEEDTREAGSLQLGGEPEDANPPRGRQTRESHGAIQPPSQQGTADNSTVGSPVSATSHQFQGLNLAGRSLTPLQQQQLMLLKSAGNQQAGLADPMSTAALDQAAQLRQGLLQSQMAQYNALQAQNRQSSRFPFSGDVSTKNISNARMLSQMQQPGIPNPLSAPSPQHALASGFYASGVQGPPPGLKTAGTPPISGGGMFAQGHGFTSNANAGLGANLGKQDATPELMRELLRGRNGTNVGGLQGQEAAKREFMFPFLQQHQTPPPLTPVNGLLSSFYGSQAGVTPDSGGSQKQKKKGKKQRHANTSSGGGGVVDLVDPSILQARMHQVGANATAGQVLYGSQGQVDDEFPPLGTQSKESQPVDTFGFLKSQLSNDSSGRAGTPSLPPGLPLPHAHPVFQEQRESSKPSSPAPIVPPGLGGTPSHSRPISPEVVARSEASSSQTKDSSQVSLGSPVAKSARKPRVTTRTDILGNLNGQQKTDHQSGGIESPAALPTSTSIHESSPRKSERVLSGTSVAAPGSFSAVASRPNTPLTTTSRASDSSAPRQARILRLVETPKPEAPRVPTAPSVTASVTGMGKPDSRRQSLSSTSRPDTPGYIGSEADLYPSTSVSRSNSPPASSRIGSAPVRAITKSQAKKERRQKAREAEAKKVESATANEAPVQAPIIGRKRKTKKAPASTTESGHTTAMSATREASIPQTGIGNELTEHDDTPTTSDKGKGKAVDQTAPELEPTHVDEELDEELDEEEPLCNTVRRAIEDAEKTGRSFKELVMERTPSIPVVLAEMHECGYIDLHAWAIASPARLSDRDDLKATADDYDMMKKPNVVTAEQRKALMSGEPIQVGHDSVKHRCLITPRGAVLRCLDEASEQMFLEREAARNGKQIPYIDNEDRANVNGGLSVLLGMPEKFNLVFADADTDTIQRTLYRLTHFDTSLPDLPPLPPCDMSEEEIARKTAWFDEQTACLREPDPILEVLPSLQELEEMSFEELKAVSAWASKELERCRKECDAAEKKLLPNFRRTKKYQDQGILKMNDLLLCGAETRMKAKEALEAEQAGSS